MRACSRTCLFLLMFLAATAAAQDAAPPAKPQTQPPADAKAQPPEGAAPAEKISDAEKIARLQRTISEGDKQLEDLRSRLNDPESEYVKAQAAFQDVDSKRETARKNVDDAKAQNDAEMVKAAEEDLQNIEKQWSLARERFDLAIKERKVSQEQLSALEQKRKADQEALAKLTQPMEPKPAAAKPAEAGAGAPATAQPADSGSAPAQPASQPETQAAAPATQPPPQQPAAGQQPSGAVAIPDTGTTPPLIAPKEPSKEVQQAQVKVAEKQEAAKEAEEQARSVEDRIAGLQASIKGERELLDLAQKKFDNAVKTGDTLSEELQRQWANKATYTETKPLRDQIQEQEDLQKKTRTEIRDRTARLETLRTQLNDLKDERIAALQEAEHKQEEAEKAKRELADLQNPFTPQNLIGWLVNHGPKIVGIAVGMFVLLLLANIVESRLVPIMAKHGRGGASIEDRENRAKTLMSVFHNTVRVVVIIGGILMLLGEVGLNIIPLVTAAGIAGLAIAFGAQNLIKDYFYGFTILLENQYTVNDVVRIAGIAGMVERITLRITVLRDLEGVVHFVPHGEIKAVSNMTHGWSRALFDIGIAYKESADQVMSVLMDLGKELRRDPEYSPFVLDDPEMLGVDQFGDSAVVVKFLIKTRPMKQWAVKREMLRRIKNKFDELGIEIPFPQRTVYHRYEQENGSPSETPRLPQFERPKYSRNYPVGD